MLNRFSRLNHIKSTRIFSPHKNRYYTSHILHLTDSEGTKHFVNTINQSTIVNYHPDKGLTFATDEASYFIFGGDASDRGHHDLSILQMLIDFKKKHPNNVFLLLGNREITKNRIQIELNPTWIRERLQKSEKPRWLMPVQIHALLTDYIINDMRTKGINCEPHDTITIQHYINSLSISECQLIYLKWMLEKTMGCPHTFRYRREELQRKNHNTRITDEDVLQSFIKESAPTGLSGQYLQLAQVGVLIPETNVLAIHGGLTDDNIGKLPSTTDDTRIINARLWIEKYNNWYQKQIGNWLNFSSIGLTPPACTALDENALPMPNQTQSIITANMLNSQRQFMPLSSDVSQYLQRNNIQLVLTGHQPSGDYPAMIRNERSLIINGDTGYSEFDPNKPDDTRGAAIHTLEIKASRHKTSVHIQGTLSNNLKTETQFTIDANGMHGDAHVGTVLEDHWLVQCRLKTGDYRLIQQKDTRVTYAIVSLYELQQRLNQTTRSYSILFSK